MTDGTRFSKERRSLSVAEKGRDEKEEEGKQDKNTACVPFRREERGADDVTISFAKRVSRLHKSTRGHESNNRANC